MVEGGQYDFNVLIIIYFTYQCNHCDKQLIYTVLI